MSSIIRTTRASAAHLATAQKHARGAEWARSEARTLRNAVERGFTPEHAHQEALDRAKAKDAEAARLERLARIAMAKHERARALLGD